MAAALAYYTIFSLPALLVIVLAVCGVVFEPADVRGKVEEEIRTVLGPDGAAQVRTMIEQASRPGHGLVATILGVIVLLFGATGAIAQLQDALNTAWGVQPDPKRGGVRVFLIKRLLSFALVLGIAFLLLVSLLLTTAISALSHVVMPSAASVAWMHIVKVGVDLLVITLLFGAIFKFLPDANIAWRDVGVGAAVTAGLFVVGKFALGVYFGNARLGNAYGAAGSLALVLLWVYYSAVILFFGAEFTQVWARQRGKRIRPARGAVRIIRREIEFPSDETDASMYGARDTGQLPFPEQR